MQLRPLGHKFMSNRTKGFAAYLTETSYISTEKKGPLKAPFNKPRQTE
jgi:hypothetical protein